MFVKFVNAKRNLGEYCETDSCLGNSGVDVRYLKFTTYLCTQM